MTAPVTLAMIQALIPLGLKAVEDALLTEARALAGPRYAVPHVRDWAAQCEVPLATYVALRSPHAQDAGLFRQALGSLSCRQYETATEAVLEAFGLVRSSVSRRFIRASA